MKSMLCAGLVIMLLSGSAAAGQLNFADGRGSWQSTMCAKPERPESLPQDPEAEAGDLNARVAAYNVYSSQIQAYLDCVAREVERDAQGATYVLTESAKKLQQVAQDELATIQKQLRRR
jgi:hypothetical protein